LYNLTALSNLQNFKHRLVVESMLKLTFWNVCCWWKSCSILILFSFRFQLPKRCGGFWYWKGFFTQKGQEIMGLIWHGNKILRWMWYRFTWMVMLRDCEITKTWCSRYSLRRLIHSNSSFLFKQSDESRGRLANLRETPKKSQNSIASWWLSMFILLTHLVDKTSTTPSKWWLHESPAWFFSEKQLPVFFITQL